MPQKRDGSQGEKKVSLASVRPVPDRTQGTIGLLVLSAMTSLRICR